MSSKKRKFLKAGAILAIISAVFAILTGAGALMLKKYVTEGNVVNILKASNEFVYEEADDSYTITFTDDDGIERTLTKEELVEIIDYVQKKMGDYGASSLGFGIATLVISIIVLSKANQNKFSKGMTISLMILAFLGGNLLTFAFMIVALCLKDMPQPTLDNINEIKESIDDQQY